MTDSGETPAEQRRRPPARPCPEELTFLDLVRTADLLGRLPATVLKSADLSPAQYNVLRILRGSPGGLSCGEIATRLISRDPDLTRLFDRLEKRGLIVRRRDSRDRRTVRSSITSRGRALLARLDVPVRDAHRRQLGHLGSRRRGQLAELLAVARARAEGGAGRPE